MMPSMRRTSSRDGVQLGRGELIDNKAEYHPCTRLRISLWITESDS